MRSLAVVVVVALTAPAAAASHKILVLPVEGTVDPATRTRLTADIARLARSLDGQVASGSATFADTALAVGCDPRAAGCSDEVMATLGVDELIWATATKEGSHTRLVVRRAARGTAVRELSATFPVGNEHITSEIAPLFAPPGALPEPSAPAPAPAAAHPPAAPPPMVAVTPATEAPRAPAVEPGAMPAAPAGPAAPGDDRRDRTTGIALAAGGGGALVLGIALWASYSSLQGSIDHHAIRTPADFRDLTSLEDRAATYAIAGDVFVVAGLIAGGIGGYLLYRDHKQHAMIVAPAPAPGGGVTIAVTGDLW